MQNPTTAIRLILAAAAVLAGHAGVYALKQDDLATEAVLPQPDMRQLPIQLGSWTGEDFVLDPKQAGLVGTDVMVQRLYRHPAGRAVSLHMGAWQEYWLGPPHLPEICYQGAGWQIVSKKELLLQVDADPPVPVRLLQLERQGDVVQVVYWYQMGEHVVLDRGGVRRIRQGLRGEAQRPAMVKVMMQQSMTANAKAAETSLLDFAKQIRIWTRNLH